MTILVRIAVILAAITIIYLANAYILGSLQTTFSIVFDLSALLLAVVLGVIWGYVGALAFMVDFWVTDKLFSGFFVLSILYSLLVAIAVGCHLPLPLIH